MAKAKTKNRCAKLTKTAAEVPSSDVTQKITIKVPTLTMAVTSKGENTPSPEDLVQVGDDSELIVHDSHPNTPIPVPSPSPDSVQFVCRTPSYFHSKETRPRNVEDPVATDTGPPLKKRKVDEASRQTGHDDPVVDDDEHKEESQNFTVHVQVYQTVVEKKPGRAGKVSTTTTFMSKGPFKFNTKLPVSKFEWKFEGQPQSAPCKKIANEDGFEALLDAIKVKRTTGHVVIWLYTPRPPKEEDEWGDEYAEQLMGDGNDGAEDSLSGNKARIAGLEAKFWATAIITGKATLSEASNSSHFAAANCLKVPKQVPPQSHNTNAVSAESLGAAHNPLMANAPLPVQYYPQSMLPPVGYAQPPPPPYGFMPYYPSPSAYIQASSGFIPGSVPYQYQQPTSAGSPHQILISSPSTRSHNVSLSEFCMQYGISESDKQKLATLEYHPGHHGVERLEEKEWRGHGKFTKLGWDAFLDAHIRFCKAIKSGQF